MRSKRHFWMIAVFLLISFSALSVSAAPPNFGLFSGLVNNGDAPIGMKIDVMVAGELKEDISVTNFYNGSVYYQFAVSGLEGDEVIVFLDGREAFPHMTWSENVINQNIYVDLAGYDQDGDGYDYLSDCNDADEDINPGAEEICDGIDNDCDSEIDEDGVCPDTDGDGIIDLYDNCCCVYNPDQLDSDLDGYGNMCDTDDDGDGIYDVDEMHFQFSFFEILKLIEEI